LVFTFSKWLSKLLPLNVGMLRLSGNIHCLTPKQGDCLRPRL
jgi:hypothetical protein